MMPLHGVVLVGGMSRRMGRDKALLCYDGRTTQLERVAEMLAASCESVEAACRPDQVRTAANITFREDAYPAWGPLAGILTALEAHPQKAVLAVACDLPFLTREVITRLVQGRQSGHWATAFAQEDGFVEPLCAIYEPEAREVLHAYMAKTGRRSPREALGQPGVVRLSLLQPELLTNVNSPDEFARALDVIRCSADESSPAHP